MAVMVAVVAVDLVVCMLRDKLHCLKEVYLAAPPLLPATELQVPVAMVAPVVMVPVVFAFCTITPPRSPLRKPRYSQFPNNRKV